MGLENVTGEQIYRATSEMLDEVITRLGALPEKDYDRLPKELQAASNWIGELGQHPEECVADPRGTYESCLKKL